MNAYITNPYEANKTVFLKCANEIIYYTTLLLERSDFDEIYNCKGFLKDINNYFIDNTKTHSLCSLYTDIKTSGTIIVGTLEILACYNHLMPEEKKRLLSQLQKYFKQFLKNQDQ